HRRTKEAVLEDRRPDSGRVRRLGLASATATRSARGSRMGVTEVPRKGLGAFSLQVIVDADACPRGAMEVLRRLRREYGYKLVTVASFHHDIGGVGPAGGGEPDGTDGAAGADDAPGATDAPGAVGAGIEHVTVGDAPDEADLAVVNRTRPGDIVVTQDWGLAALVLGKGARCLSPAGYEY